MPNNWYYARDGQRFGPVSDKQLKTLAESAQLHPTDQVWRDGMRDWVPASKITGLFASVVAQVAQPLLSGETATVASYLSGLALKHVCEALGATLPTEGLSKAFELLANRFRDQSQRLPEALERANRKAWRALRSSLAAETWWQKCKEATVHADERALVQQIRTFLDEVELPGRKERPEFCTNCLAELKQAEEKGDLGVAPPDADQLARLTLAFAPYDQPAGISETESRLLEALAAKLKPNYPNLGWLLGQKPTGQSPLLVLAARYFFRREVEEDRQLFQGLTFAHLETLSRSQREGFALLEEQGNRVEQSLASIQATVTATHGSVLRIEEELQKQTPQLQQLYQLVVDLQQRLDLQGKELRPGASFSLRTDEEKRQVKAFLERYRQLPNSERRARPALLNAVAKLEVAAGDFQAAQDDFQQVATLVGDAETQAEVHFNRYLSYLESRDWPGALEALGRAIELAPDRYVPFPVRKYQPKSILGAGGFGVAFLCENTLTGAQVVLKTLRGDRAGVDVKQILREARALASVRHPAVIQLFDCDYLDQQQTRAYLVMDYFDPQTLEKLVLDKGALSVADFLPVAVQLAEGMLAAHEKGVLHRDIKPANILARRGRSGWEIRVIDFGLAVTQKGSAAHVSTVRSSHSETGSAGTLDYAAPEQLGRLSGVKIGPYTDVYGFARTCCFALFGTPQPLPRQFRHIPDNLADLLQDCLEESPAKRPSSFARVLELLEKVRGGGQPDDDLASGVEMVEETPPLRPVMPTQKMSAVGRAWYYLKNDQRFGPFSEADLVQLITAGRVEPHDLVWSDGMPDWLQAGSIESLFPTVRSAPPQPPAGALRPAQVRLSIPAVSGLLAAGASHSWRVHVDGKVMGDGWARDGLNLDLELSTGRHRFDIIKWESGEDDRKRFELEFPRPGLYEVRFAYSWVLGKFSIGGVDWALQNSKLEIVRAP